MNHAATVKPKLAQVQSKIYLPQKFKVSSRSLAHLNIKVVETERKQMSWH